MFHRHGFIIRHVESQGLKIPRKGQEKKKRRKGRYQTPLGTSLLLYFNISNCIQEKGPINQSVNQSIQASKQAVSQAGRRLQLGGKGIGLDWIGLD